MTDLKVVQLHKQGLQENPPEFLRALAEDIDSGAYPNYKQAVLVVQAEDGAYKLWSFGPGIRGSFEALGLLQMGHVILTDQMLNEM